MARKPVVTPERMQLICEALVPGESETAACRTAGIGLTAWNAAKRCNADLRGRIALARDDWARLRHARHAAALDESQWTRSAARKAKRPQPTHQANLVMWHLVTRVPLNFVAIPESEVKTACEKFNIPRLKHGRARKVRLDCSERYTRNERHSVNNNHRRSVPYRTNPIKGHAREIWLWRDSRAQSRWVS